MPYKARKISETVVPVAVVVGAQQFSVDTRYISPAHMSELRQAATIQRMDPQTGRLADDVNSQHFAELLFDAAVIEVHGLTPAIVDEMIELEADSDPPPQPNGDGTIHDRAFIKFLWLEAPTRHFFSQVYRGLDRALEIKKLQRDLEKKT